MLHRIVAYARDHDIDTEPGFRPKVVKWAIECNEAGQFLGLHPLGTEKDKGLEFLKCADLTQPEMKSGGVTKSHFLVESLGVIAGVAGKDDDAAKNALKHAYFWDLLSAAATEVPALRGLAALHADGGSMARLRAKATESKAKWTDSATFICNDIYPAREADWHEWWRRRRRRTLPEGKPTAAGSGVVPCFLTGEAVVPTATHEKIKGLTDVGGLAMGDVLIGFKQDSFCSYGFEQSANAAMSVDSAKAYVSGLNELIARQSARVAGTKHVFWFQKPVLPAEDPFAFLRQGDDSAEAAALGKMRKLVDAIRAGDRPDLAGNQYFGLELSSNGGRAVIRSWWEGAFSELLVHTVQWFDDLSIDRPVLGPAPPPKFFAALAAAVRDPKQIVPPMEISLWRAAVTGGPIPESIHAKVLLRVRTLVTTGESPSYVQAGLLKAFHRRKGRYMIETTVSPEGPVPYQCGRLLAVLANLQSEALGDVGAGVVARFYPAASATPSLVLGRLILNAQNHLQKLRGDRPGLAHWFDQQIQGVLSTVPVSALPQTFSLEEQSLFALGFYQQKAAARKKE